LKCKTNDCEKLIFQNDVHLADTVKNQTLFKRIPFDDDDDDDNICHTKIDLPIYLKLSFDELSEYIAHSNSNENNNRILKTLIASPKYRTGIELLLLTNMFRYSSMNAIIDMYSSKKQRLQILFDFLTEGPFLPEQNLIEPTSSRLFPWGITYWKRALSGIPLHGSVLDMADTRNIEVCLLNNLRREREREFSLIFVFHSLISYIYKIHLLFYVKFSNGSNMSIII